MPTLITKKVFLHRPVKINKRSKFTKNLERFVEVNSDIRMINEDLEEFIDADLFTFDDMIRGTSGWVSKITKTFIFGMD